MVKESQLPENANVKVSTKTWNKLPVKRKIEFARYCKNKNIKIIHN